MSETNISIKKILEALKLAEEGKNPLEVIKGVRSYIEDRCSSKELESTVNSERMKDVFKLFIKPQEFEIGQLVKWKIALKNRRKPDYDEPCIVVEKLDKPIVSDVKDAGSPYFNEPLDMQIGILDEDNDFLIYHVDSRRFEIF